MDKNKDGIVTLDEFLESCQEVSKERPQNIKSLDLGKEIWGLRACRREGMRNLWPQVRATTATPTNSKLRIPAPSPPATGLWLVLAKHSLSQTAWAGYGLGWMWKPKGGVSGKPKTSQVGNTHFLTCFWLNDPLLKLQGSIWRKNPKAVILKP